MDNPETREAVARDIQLGERFDVNATPTFFINGKKYDGTRFVQELQNLIAQRPVFSEKIDQDARGRIEMK